MGLQPFFVNDFLQHGLRISKELAGLFAHYVVLENSGIFSVKIPRNKKRRPINGAYQRFDRIIP